MRIPFCEFSNNLEKFMYLAGLGEEVIVTNNGKDMVRLVSYCNESEVSERAALYGELPDIKVSYEEFISLTENSDLRYELIDGELFLLASPVYKHQVAIRELLLIFSSWFKGKKCSPLTAPFDITLTKENNNICVVQPDIVVICDTENIDEKGKYKGVPSLVIEVWSDSTRRKDMVKKLDLYIKTGVKEYWMADPESKVIHVYSFKDNDIDNYKVYTINDTVKSYIFSGLEVNPGDIFNA